MIDRQAAQARREQAEAEARASGSLAAKVFAYTDCIERTVRAAKDPGFGDAGWAELEAMIDVAGFERVGNFMEVMSWPEYRAMLTQWGTTTEFWSNFRGISVCGARVFLELEEHNTPAGAAETVVNSLSVYEFDAAGRLRHLDIYLQMPPAGGAPAWG